jgi:hypothetical protein
MATWLQLNSMEVARPSLFSVCSVTIPSIGRNGREKIKNISEMRLRRSMRVEISEFVLVGKEK